MNDEAFMSQGGEAGALMRSIDWAKNPIGPAAAWPQSLKTIIGVMLDSGFAMRVLWGPELIFLYNDGYRPILGTSKHPGAMGSRTEDSFAEVWDRVGPLFRRVMAGESVSLVDGLLPLDRNGFIEECYFTLSYSPIRLDDGQVGGVLGVVAETTDRVLAERRLDTLRELAEGAATVETSEQARAAVSAVLAGNSADLPFSLVYLVDPADDGVARLACRVGLAEESLLAPALIEKGSPSESVWPCSEALDRHGVLISDLARHEAGAGSRAAPPVVTAALVLPLARHGLGARHGYFVVGLNPRCALDEKYRSFLETLGEQIAAAFTRVHVLEEERRRAFAIAMEARRAVLFGQVGVALTQNAPLDVQLRQCCEALVEHLDAAFARIWVLSSAGNTLELVASAGLYTHLDGPHSRVPVGMFKIGKIAEERLPHLTNDVLSDPRVGDKAWAEREGMRAFAGYPLIVNDKLVGVLALFSRQALAPDTLATLSSTASSCAVGIERQRVEAERETLIVQLGRTNAELDQFAYVASHDLKAPLRGIANLSQWIEEDLAEDMTEESRDQMRLLRGRVHRLEGLIDGILSYSRAGRVREALELVDVGRLLDDLVELLAPPAHAHIEIAGPLPTLNTERVPLQQVFMNLIGNALKYSKRDRVEVFVSGQESGRAWSFAVRDNGPGIAPQYHERIWGLFQTLEARDKVEGTGVGLSVVKKIVEARGGRVALESVEGEGATFHFTWPK